MRRSLQVFVVLGLSLCGVGLMSATGFAMGDRYQPAEDVQQELGAEQQQTREAAQQRIEQAVSSQSEEQKAQIAAVAADREPISGTIVAINPALGTLQLQAEPSPAAQPLAMAVAGGHTEVGLNQQTTVLHGDQQLRLDDLQVGDKIQVRLQVQEGRSMAQLIRLVQPIAPRR